MGTDKNNQILQVARMYYIDRIPQNKIAEELNISKPTVSRLIKKAKDLGYVKIKVEQPVQLTYELERALEKKYELKEVRIVSNSYEEETDINLRLNTFIFEGLEKLTAHDSIIGITWNDTISNLGLFSALPEPKAKNNITFVQINGAIIPSADMTNCTEFMAEAANFYDGSAYQLCAPIIFEEKRVAKLIRMDQKIERVLSLASRSDIALLSVNNMNDFSKLTQLGFRPADIILAKNNGAVGVLCGHFLGSRGQLVSQLIDQRIVGLTMSQIAHIPNKILIAKDIDDRDVIKGLLNRKMIDYLYITSDLAYALN